MEDFRLVYVGRVLSSKNMVVHKYNMVGEDGKLLNDTMTFKKKVTQCNIGNIIECQKTETGVNGPYTVIGTYPDKESIRRWYTRDTVTYDEYQANSQVIKKRVSAYETAIIELRKGYRDLTGTHKQGFINRLIIEITK